MRQFLFAFVFFLSLSVYALDWRPEVSASFLQNYELKNTPNTFESSGLGLGVSFFFKDEMGFADPELTPLATILGFGAHYTQLKTKSTNGVPSLVPESFESDLIKLKAILGFSIYHWRWEIPLSALYLKENTSPLDGDEKYGWSVGLNWLYPLSGNFFVQVGYEYCKFESGKNASTGQQGSLANDVTLSGPQLSFSYLFQGSAY